MTLPRPAASLDRGKAGVLGGERSARTHCLQAGVSRARLGAGRLASDFPGDRGKWPGIRGSAALRVLGGARASVWVKMTIR